MPSASDGPDAEQQGQVDRGSQQYDRHLEHLLRGEAHAGRDTRGRCPRRADHHAEEDGDDEPLDDGMSEQPRLDVGDGEGCDAHRSGEGEAGEQSWQGIRGDAGHPRRLAATIP